MAYDDTFSLWAARLCLAVAGALIATGMYYGNVRFAPIAVGFMILAGVCYAERRVRRARIRRSHMPRPSLTSGNAPRISSRSPYPLGP